MTVREQNNKFVKLSEGFNKYPYRCPEDKWSVGYGFNIEDNPIPQFIEDANLWYQGQELSLNVAEQWLDYLLDQSIIELRTALPLFDSYSNYIQFVLTDMTYNMGISTLLGFKNMLRAINDGNKINIIIEMVDSNWFGQVKSRAVKLIRVIGEGNIEVAFK